MNVCPQGGGDAHCCMGASCAGGVCALPAPLVSVIMNCRDAARTLPETLASVRAQTFRNFEVILWDSASIDGSGEAALSGAAGLPCFRYFRVAEPAPLGAARNDALARARGELVAFLDCDDLWHPEKLARQVARMRARPEVGLLCTDTVQMLDGRLLRRTFFQWARPVRGRVFAELVERQWASMSSVMVRRAALDSVRTARGWFAPDLQVCEDADLQYRIAARWDCDYLAEPLTVWRIHGNNATLRKFALFAREARVMVERFRREVPDFSTRYAAVERLLLRRASFREAASLWAAGHGAQARQALRGMPGRKAALLRLLSWLPAGCFSLAARLYWRLR